MKKKSTQVKNKKSVEKKAPTKHFSEGQIALAKAFDDLKGLHARITNNVEYLQYKLMADDLTDEWDQPIEVNDEGRQLWRRTLLDSYGDMRELQTQSMHLWGLVFDAGKKLGFKDVELHTLAKEVGG
jgi:hypothetical protein